MVDSPSSSSGWAGRVAFSERDGIAYRPHELLVRRAATDVAERLLGTSTSREPTGNFWRYRGSDENPLRVRDEISNPLRAAEEFRLEGAFAQPNHVLFSHSDCECCEPHPWFLFNGSFDANPFRANPFRANPFRANPFRANPFRANPFRANPFRANYAPSPLALLASGAPEARAYRATGIRQHSAEASGPPPRPPAEATTSSQPTGPSIVVVDTGIAVPNLRPYALAGLAANTDSDDEESPDENGDTLLDPVAGHGTFIAGVIEGIAPNCRLSVNGLLNGEGDVAEADVADTLDDLATNGAPDLVNLSFGGYTVVGMERLHEAVHKLQNAGTVIVASAGNDATCMPSYPGALPDVIAVGAIGPDGPAFFTNYGSWVRACAPGIDIVSTFFTGTDTADAADLAEWVCWSGTSFSAPIVVGALAEQMRLGLTNTEAVERLIDAPALLRMPSLGTVVDRQPWT
jgi:hypothetical protein